MLSVPSGHGIAWVTDGVCTHCIPLDLDNHMLNNSTFCRHSVDCSSSVVECCELEFNLYILLLFYPQSINSLSLGDEYMAIDSGGNI